MSIFRQLTKTIFDVCTIPVDVAKDIITMGGALTDEDVPYTIQKAKQLNNDLDDVRKEIEK